VCVGLAHLVLWKWFSCIPPQFLGCLGVLVPGVCVYSLLFIVLYTRISAVNDDGDLNINTFMHVIYNSYSKKVVRT